MVIEDPEQNQADIINEFLGMVLDNVYSGIIVCDDQCRIVFMNRVYAELLKTDSKLAIGRHIKEFFPVSRLGGVLESGVPELGQKCSLKSDAVLLVNRIPLKQGNKVTGVILQTIFRDYKDFTDLVNRLNLLERKVKFQEQALESLFSARYTFDSIIGESTAIKEVKLLARKFALTDSPVLILGPTGSGKELFAHSIHAAGTRSSGPFVCLNCAAVPKDLIESELFGYESGAFTGASKRGKPGQIEMAMGGTLYLDEIGELPLNAQAKLLRVVENKTLVRLGGVKSKEIDFRLVTATNRDLREMIRLGEFREDLYFRLNTMILNIPPLNKRTGDIPILMRHFLSERDRVGHKLTQEALNVLEEYDWPGNLRELKNVLDRALSVAETGEIGVEHLPAEVIGLSCGPKVSVNPDNSLAEEVARFEKSVLKRAIAVTKGNMSRTAKLLGISRSALYEKSRKYHLNMPFK